MDKTRILIVDEKREIENRLKSHFGNEKLIVDSVKSISYILEMFSKTTYDILLWQTALVQGDPDDGLGLLEVIGVESPRTQVIILTEDKNIDIALEGIKVGAFQYLKRPFMDEEFIQLIELALRKQPSTGQNTLLKPEKRFVKNLDGLYGVSLPMQHVFEQIQEAATTDVSVLITGETGTGKDIVASVIHRLSSRGKMPYITVHTGAMPSELIASELFGHAKGAFTNATETTAGKFEQADKGTIFLDEIGTMDHKMQVSLLRILEKSSFQRIGGKKNISVNVRVIAATNENLETFIEQKKFRKDLYYRFDVFRIQIPPLRNRPGDIAFLSNQFVTEFNNKYNKDILRISGDTMHYLENYHWPGNVRELRNVIQRSVLLGKKEVLESNLLPARILSHKENKLVHERCIPFQIGMSLSEVEKEFIGMTLAHNNGNKTKTAQDLGITRKALYNKLERFNVIGY
ncbi:MAG: sigma-54-dependent Fis family transcriptional regulator [Nitrospinae bacterium]|nr:sigma-54-dependent Fis family transcriptional regulator [Nitrospinota bacterium]